MIDLFYQGGPLFMGVLSLILVALLSVIFYILYTGRKEMINWPYEVGLLALVVGVLGQMIGLYEAFAAIQQMGSVSQSMLAGGLKVSSITTIYGLLIFILGILGRSAIRVFYR